MAIADGWAAATQELVLQLRGEYEACMLRHENL
jgi:hypothetical protein